MKNIIYILFFYFLSSCGSIDPGKIASAVDTKKIDKKTPGFSMYLERAWGRINAPLPPAMICIAETQQGTKIHVFWHEKLEKFAVVFTDQRGVPYKHLLFRDRDKATKYCPPL